MYSLLVVKIDRDVFLKRKRIQTDSKVEGDFYYFTIRLKGFTKW
ncbi:hypothetical protein DJ94_2815 [Bacillus pseudomycoides]|nr:hypothetical protein DJ94_2815 [Bacillus pseudomycoides]